jgi:hypothetical protein
MKCSLYYDLFAQGFQNWLFLAGSMLSSVICLILYIICGALQSARWFSHSFVLIMFRVGSLAGGIGWCIIGVYQTYIGYLDYERLIEERSAK